MSSRLFFVFLIAAGVIAGCSASREERQPNSPPPGTAAPDFTLKDLNGKFATLSEYRGRPVLLAYWAVGCGPCRAEAPHLNALYEKYVGRGLVVLAVNAWNEPRKKVEAFVSEKRLKYPILMNGHEIFAERYGCRYIPQVYVIDKQGVIAYSHLNFLPGDERDLETEILKVL